MKPKYPAAELRLQVLHGRISPCEIRAFAAYHKETLNETNHTAFVEAFVMQLGAAAQHTKILDILSVCAREFKAGKISYKPPGRPVITSVLDVARWVGAQINGGLAHAKVRV